MGRDEIKIDVTDVTLAEADGYFDRVIEIMSKESIPSQKWILRTDITILSASGIASMVLQLHFDGSIYIIDYTPSIVDVFYNFDIQAISTWAQERGWKVPQPHYELVKSNKEFWKHFWETLLIDSDFLDNLYGERPQLKNL